MLKFSIPQDFGMSRYDHRTNPCNMVSIINKKKESPKTFLRTPSGTRTLDPLIKSQLLYQLS